MFLSFAFHFIIDDSEKNYALTRARLFFSALGKATPEALSISIASGDLQYQSDEIRAKRLLAWINGLIAGREENLRQKFIAAMVGEAVVKGQKVFVLRADGLTSSQAQETNYWLQRSSLAYAGDLQIAPRSTIVQELYFSLLPPFGRVDGRRVWLEEKRDFEVPERVSELSEMSKIRI